MSPQDGSGAAGRGRKGRFGLRALGRWRRKSGPLPSPASGPVPDDAPRFYDGLFAPLRTAAIEVVVIVDDDREVVALWHDFFPHARILVLDRAAMREPLPERLAARVRVETGDHADPGFLAGFARRVAPSVVIDHRARSGPGHAACLRALYGGLAPGGVHLVMDLGLGGPEAATDAHALVEDLARRLIGAPATRADDPFLEDAVATTDHVAFRGRGCALRKRARPLTRLHPAPARDLSDPPAMDFGRPSYRRGEAILAGAPDWIAQSVARHAGQTVEPPEALVCRFRDATVFGRGMVRLGERLVSESLVNLRPGDGDESLRLQADGAVHAAVAPPHETKAVVEEPALLLAQRWDENYGHWIVDVLPRIVAAGRVVDLSAIRVALHDNPRMRRVCLDSLALFGVAPEQVVWLGPGEAAFRDLIYPTPVTASPWVKSPLILEAAERIVAAVAPDVGSEPPQGRLYVSRNRWGRRRLLNEPEIVARLARRGYRVVHPESLSFAEQVTLFAGAERVVGAMGAALANILYAPPGLRLLALANRDMVDDFFFDLAGLKGARYYGLHGESAQPGLGMNSDFSISPELLEACLDEWEF